MTPDLIHAHALGIKLDAPIAVPTNRTAQRAQHTAALGRPKHIDLADRLVLEQEARDKAELEACDWRNAARYWRGSADGWRYVALGALAVLVLALVLLAVRARG